MTELTKNDVEKLLKKCGADGMIVIAIHKNDMHTLAMHISRSQLGTAALELLAKSLEMRIKTFSPESSISEA